MKNHDTNSKNYDSVIIPKCKITADQAEDLHFTSFAGDSDTESAFFTDDEPPKKANGVAVGPMMAITRKVKSVLVTEEKKDAHKVFDELREGEKCSNKYEVVKGFVSRVWKMIVGEKKDTAAGGDENNAFDDLERGGV